MPELIVNGAPVAVAEGASVAAAVMQAGAACRISVGGGARAPLCGMGVCYECRVTLDGVPHVRSCQVPARAGMRVSATVPEAIQLEPGGESSPAYRFELLIVGAGPAGIAAALAAGDCGVTAAVVDDNPSAGGQIWRGGLPASWQRRVAAARAAGRLIFFPGHRITHSPADGVLAAATVSGPTPRFEYQRLILATGARERFLPFPGWTLPNVTGAGGLQALVKAGLPIAGKRVVVAGAGPLLLAVAAYLRHRGAQVLAVCDQAERAQWTAFTAGLVRWPSKLAQALALAPALLPLQLAGRMRHGVWPVEARGLERLEAVVLGGAANREVVACDYLACGFHLAPNLELAHLLGCDSADGFVAVDALQRTSRPDVYCAGEPTGIGGLDVALLEGAVAGRAAAGDETRARALARRTQVARRFADALNRLCTLRPELRQLPTPDTLICRCEDVAWSRLAPIAAWRDARIQTRCGMGACQGRICGAALEFLRDWNCEAPRPPASPTPLGSLMHV